ncbi:AMP-binding protein [Tardiphaga sp. vice154]|uniref:AMP-binding protein n=1 Tax=Tardiphaga sp. vice154 TaxID=2592814 RepID=UPI001165829F|nr:AMP-binding protein [Tardiphaga sp. vice154]QDM22705.1 AMP-binding protein [Tardiphaga sp. vice154]
MSRPLLDLPFTSWSYDRILRWRAENTPDRPFICFEDGVYQSYGEIWQCVCDLAKGLANAGVQRGDRVAIFAGNGLTAVHVWLAINVLGATDAPINPAFRGQSLVHALNMLGVTIVIADRQLLPVLDGVASELTALSHIYFIEDPMAVTDPSTSIGSIAVAPLRELVDDASGYQPAGASFDNISSVLMTSGTSGPSKGVMVPHAQAILIARNSIDGMRVTETDIYYVAHPVFHMSPRYCAITAAMLVGARVWLDTRFNAEQWLDRIKLSGATVTIGHGPLLEMIYAQPPRADDAETALTRIGTSPFPKHIAAPFEQRFGIKGIETWGMTEIGIPCWHPYDAPLRPGSCGKILTEWFEVEVVHPDTDVVLPVGDLGELVVRSRYPFTLMQGYLGRPDATNEAWRNLWFHSGDSGYIDSDGWVYFVDRLKDRIRRRAENISSYDIEVAAQQFAGVREAAAIGIASEFAGDDDVKICVVALPGCEVHPEALIIHLAKRLPHHMVPRYVEVLVELPRTPTKKVQKAQLRQAGVTPQTWDRKLAGIVLRQLA